MGIWVTQNLCQVSSAASIKDRMRVKENTRYSVDDSLTNQDVPLNLNPLVSRTGVCSNSPFSGDLPATAGVCGKCLRGSEGGVHLDQK